MTPVELAEWVAASCQAQGVPVRVADPVTVSAVVALLGGPGGGGRARTRSVRATRRRTGRSEAPDRLDAGGVEGSGSADSGGDHDVVDDAAHDRGLTVQVQTRPAIA